MGRVGQSPQPGYMTPNINRPDSFTVSGPVNTNGVAVFTIKQGENVLVEEDKFPHEAVVSDKGNLQGLDETVNTSSGQPTMGSRILNFGTTNQNTAPGRLAYQGGGINSGWANVTQTDITRQDNPTGYKMNEGDMVASFVREGKVVFNNTANIGQAFVTGTGGVTTQWQQVNGNIFQVGYGLGNGSGSAGKLMYADFAQETKYPLDFLKKEQHWFAFSTRRLSYSAPYCMKVYRNNDPTDTLDIGWDSNGYIKISDITLFSQGAIVRCHTWYNQSGNGYHATVPNLATNTTRGPGVMISDGTFRTIGNESRLALDFNGAQYMVADTGGSGDVDQPLWATCVGAFDTTANAHYMFDGDDDDRTLFFGDGTSLRWGAGNYPSISSARNTDDHIWIMMFNGADSFFRQDGTTLTANSTNVDGGDNDGMTIGTRYTAGAGNMLNGKIAEIVMFQGNASMAFTDQWISRYETQTNSYFDIY